MNRPSAIAVRVRSARGQAITETVLMTWGLVLLIAIVVQAFLIDQTAFTLTTKAHARLFKEIAYPGNTPGRGYSQGTVTMDGPDSYVPMIGYFRKYGLTREDLHIRSTGGGPKKLTIGRGTRADVGAGLAGLADATALLSQMSSSLQKLEDAKQRAEALKAAIAAASGKKK